MNSENFLVSILVDNVVKDVKVTVQSVNDAKTGDILYLSEAQHINYYTKIRFNRFNESHCRYLERGLLFESAADAILFSKAFINRHCDKNE